jgi:hypothetical protein
MLNHVEPQHFRISLVFRFGIAVHVHLIDLDPLVTGPCEPFAADLLAESTSLGAIMGPKLFF